VDSCLEETYPPFLPSPDEWPEPLAEEAYHGVIGEIARKIEPETEADPAGVLTNLLVGIGNLLGSGLFSLAAILHQR
jgi:hypothetical protein